MAFTLDNVVPWGRAYDEYVAMCRTHRPGKDGCTHRAWLIPGTGTISVVMAIGVLFGPGV